MTAKRHAPRPDEFICGVTRWEIYWLDEEEWKRDHPSDADGGTYASKRQVFVRLREDRPEVGYQEVVLHELLHVAWVEGNMPNLHWPEPGDDMEEQAVGTLTGPMLMILKQNPMLVAWLMSDGDKRR